MFKKSQLSWFKYSFADLLLYQLLFSNMKKKGKDKKVAIAKAEETPLSEEEDD